MMSSAAIANGGGVAAGSAVAILQSAVIGAVVGTGFTAAGIAAGSLAAQAMSVAAVANGGGVAAGSVVAVLQSAGAAGVSGAASAAVGAAAGLVNLIV
ncbi:hypothetical protein F2P81_003682 [Scophthalmus maximus]|uniref:Interferon alpha-inducible protein 27-like protein 2A n=1 Tax=Scophthalmus maximus TaxID=52904 RepID=A0A6A4TMR4_SCOMX|nr:hypothetical protein F2P81_003682 [Scophthalmus maximus]